MLYFAASARATICLGGYWKRFPRLGAYRDARATICLGGYWKSKRDTHSLPQARATICLGGYWKCKDIVWQSGCGTSHHLFGWLLEAERHVEQSARMHEPPFVWVVTGS